MSVAVRTDSSYLRLPIDRSFAMKGFGTVVTGTLISGSVGGEDEVEFLPGGERLRVRGVQSGGKSVARATAGQRTAVNLAGIEHGAIRRGMVLATPGKFRATRRIDARVDSLARRPLQRDAGRVAFLEILERGTREEILSAITARTFSGATLKEVVAKT